jgi:hypothetical protein
MIDKSYSQTFNTQDIPIESSLNASFDVGESSIYINPRNPATVVMGCNAHYTGFTGAQSFFYSLNGGTTWSPSFNTNFLITSSGSDPSIAIDHLNNIYYNYLSSTASVELLSSTDFFQTTPQSISIVTSNSHDKNNLALDDRPTSNNVILYSGWKNSSDELETSYSVNSGNNWSAPYNSITQSNLPNGSFGTTSSHNYHQGINISVGPNGNVYAVWGIYKGTSQTTVTESEIGFAKSIDNGQTWTAYSIPYLHIKGIKNNTSGTTCGLRCASWVTMDVNQQNGNIYISWPNIGEPCVDPTPAVGCNIGDADIYFIKSTDGGATWSYPVHVNPNINDGLTQWYSCLASDPYSSLIGLIYYGRDASNNINTYLSLSTDEGATWQEHQINDNPFSSVTPSGTAIDYITLKINNGWIVPVWIEKRNNIVSAWTQPFEYPKAQDISLCNPVTPYYTIQKANNHITLADNGCGYEVAANSYINTYCGQNIKMNSGFHASVGSKFHAHIESNVDPFHAYEKNSYSIPHADNSSATTFCYPNPFKEFTNIGLTTYTNTTVSIYLYDDFGRLIKTLVNSKQINSGTFYYSLNIADLKLNTGIYSCLITANNERKFIKLLHVE